VLVHALAPLENYLKRLRAHDVGLSTEGFAALDETGDLVEHVLTQFDAAQPQLPDSDPLAQRIIALRDALPEPAMAHPIFGSEDVEETVAAGEDGEPAQSVGSEEIEPVSLPAPPAEAETSEPEAEPLDSHWLTSEIAAAASDLPDRPADDYASIEPEFAAQPPGPALTDESIDFHNTVDSHAAEIEAGNAEAQRIAEEKAQAERAEAERLAAEQAEAERVAAEQAEAERLAAERAEVERLAEEKAQAERAEAERLAAEQAEAERLTAERAEA
jgi:chemosensory pili system protein ChpA (sensor histidine kinase/response regulator)